MLVSQTNHRQSAVSTGSTRISTKSKIPVPVSVSLHNLLASSGEAAEQKRTKKWFRPEHAMSLLHQVRLDIVIVPPVLDENGRGNRNIYVKNPNERIVFSSVAATKTVHPSWDHLDEYIEDYLAVDSYYDSETSLYRNMRLRIWLLSDRDIDHVDRGTDQSDAAAEDKTSQDEPKSSTASDCDNRQKITTQPLLDISIHPTKLSRLAKVPTKLPINSLIIYFSDGSIRATNSLLEIVGDQDGSHADEHLKDEFGRFGDDVFRTLDQVTPSKKKREDCGVSGVSQALADTSLISSFSEVSADVADSPFLSDQTSGRRIGKQQREQLALEEKFKRTKHDVIAQDDHAEEQLLQDLIELEEAALEEEFQNLQHEKTYVLSLMDAAKDIENKIATLEESINSEKQLSQKNEFFMEARRLKILRDLRNIYPISVQPSEDRYAVRNLRIPWDIHSGMVPEEELSAALGFLCHLVILTSKYLNSQLRYRMFFNSSRSAIQEDGAMVYPLFQARMVERDQLDYAMVLIHRNVECILKARELAYSPKEHILVNMKRLFDTIVDGPV